MQIGLQVHRVGAATTPSIGEGDLLIAVSGSGETEVTQHIVSSAKNSGARVFLLTARSVSRIASISDLVIILPNAPQPLMPLGSAFESATHIFLEAIVILTMEETGMTQQEMMKRHSNLE
jgi:6-phospho-3-hexuloisomerase